MTRRWGGAFAGILLVTGVLLAQTSGGGKYRPAGIAKVGEIPYPVNTAITGMVILEVSVSPAGAAQNVQTVVDKPPLTEAAASAVKNWKYAPAMLDGQPVPGIVNVSVVFNPFNPGGVGVPTGTPAPPESLESSKGDFRPPQAKSATFAAYPVDTVRSGTTVMEVKVGKEGRLMWVREVGGPAVLSGAATSALRAWRFAPGTYKGVAVESYLAVAFVFPSAALARP
jgi:outer membrane biosynthesis protein TonB